MKLRLPTKLMLLLLIPLAVSVGGTSLVLVMLQQSEVEEMRQMRAKQVHDDLSSIEWGIFDAAKAIARLSLFGRDKDAIARYHQVVEDIPNRLAHLRATIEAAAPLGQERTRALDSIGRLDQQAMNIKQLCDQSVADLEAGRRSDAMDRIQGMRPLTNAFSHEVTDIQDAAKAIVGDEDPDAQIANRGRLKNMVIAVLIIDVLTAAIAAAYFVRDVLRRFEALMGNMHRLTQKKELAPPTAGGDEIEDLDRVLYDTALALRESENLKRHFTQMISHDLRTPLTSIQLFLDLVSQGSYGKLNDKGTQKALVADSSARRLIQLVNDLLDLEKLEANSLQLFMDDVDLQELITNCVESVQSLSEQSSIKVEATVDSVHFKADQDRLTQVIINLLGNALKFSPGNSTVRITSSVQDDDVVISIIDQGRGIPADMIDSVFDRFKQVSRDDSTKLKGTGLGLAISKLIIEQHGGKIGVESEGEGKGSRFWIRLPLAQESSVAVESNYVHINE